MINAKWISNNRKLILYIALLTLSIVLNIIMLCQPVFGTYRGKMTYWGERYDVKLSCNNGYVTIDYSLRTTDGIEKGYEFGIYRRAEDKIEILHYGGYWKQTNYTRKSVFKLTSGDDNYISILAILTQSVFGVLDVVLVLSIIPEIIDWRERKKHEKEIIKNAVKITKETIL